LFRRTRDVDALREEEGDDGFDVAGIRRVGGAEELEIRLLTKRDNFAGIGGNGKTGCHFRQAGVRDGGAVELHETEAAEARGREIGMITK
jgi:hypothetical protein